jgi:hypothetical protein
VVGQGRDAGRVRDRGLLGGGGDRPAEVADQGRVDDRLPEAELQQSR